MKRFWVPATLAGPVVSGEHGMLYWGYFNRQAHKAEHSSAFQYHVSNTYHALCWTHCETPHSTRPRTKRVLQTKVHFWFTVS